MGRELLNKGYVSQNPDAFFTLQLTDKGRRTLKERQTVTLTRHREMAKNTASHCDQNEDHDDALYLKLKELRKSLADENNVPAYVIFSDVSLHEMATAMPIDNDAFLNISGVGKIKLEKWGDLFVSTIQEHVEIKKK